MQHFMIRRFVTWIALTLILVANVMFANTVFADDDHHHDEEVDQHGHQNRQTTIDPDIAEEAGIITAIAGPQIIHETMRLYGKTQVDPQQISHIRARYPGLIKQVAVSIGDKVAAGDNLLTIEANDSLQNYVIQSPINGTVIQRHANPGEVSMDSALLTIADYQHLWVELDVFPEQAQTIHAEQVVSITAGARTTQSHVSHLMSTENSGPSIIARVPLDNSNQQWTPGLLVQGLVTINQSDVALAVDNRAIQIVDGETVVFVQEGNYYEMREIKTGRTDNSFSEVVKGVSAGESYVVENSFLIKADLEKSGAEHSH